MMIETMLDCSQDFGGQSAGGGAALPQWKRELLARRAGRRGGAMGGGGGGGPTPTRPAPDPEEEEEELRYGPGIVTRLRSRYLSLALRDQPPRATVLRRAASMEQLLDGPKEIQPARVRPPPAAPALAVRRDAVKRARSVDALSRMEGRAAPVAPAAPATPSPPPANRAPRPPRRAAPLLREAEQPPPDVVRSTLRKFESGAPRPAGGRYRRGVPPLPPLGIATPSSPRRVCVIRPLPPSVPSTRAPPPPPPLPLRPALSPPSPKPETVLEPEPLDEPLPSPEPPVKPDPDTIPTIVKPEMPTKPELPAPADRRKADLPTNPDPILSLEPAPKPEPYLNGVPVRREPVAESPTPPAVRRRANPPTGPLAGAVSVVFDFSSRKEVPDYIENDGMVLRAARRRPLESGTGADAGAGAGVAALADSSSESDCESESEVDGPSPSVGVTFVNAGVLINGRSSLMSPLNALANRNRTRQHKLKLQFDDSLTKTHEYPSETSYCEEEADPTADACNRNGSPTAGLSTPNGGAQLSEPTHSHIAQLAANTHIAERRPLLNPKPKDLHNDRSCAARIQHFNVSLALSRYAPSMCAAAAGGFELGVTAPPLALTPKPAPAPPPPPPPPPKHPHDALSDGGIGGCVEEPCAWSRARRADTDLLF